MTCGICCRGVIHVQASLEEGERHQAETHGLALGRNDDGKSVFALPCRCHRHSDNACTIYGERFSACCGYRCELLKRVQNGEVALDAAQVITRRARDAESAIYAAVGGYDPARSIWKQVASFLERSQAQDEAGRRRLHGELYLLVTSLRMLCRRHFVKRAENAVATQEPMPKDGSVAEGEAVGTRFDHT